MNIVAQLGGSLARQMYAKTLRTKESLKRAYAEEGDRLKRQVRVQLTPAFKGAGKRILTAYRQFPGTLRVYDDGGLAIATVVGPKGASAAKILEPHFTGGTIRPQRGQYLLLRIGKLFGTRIQPNEVFRQSNIAILPARSGAAVVVQKTPGGRGRGKVLAVLARQAKFERRVDLESLNAQAATRLSRAVIEAFGD